MQRFAYEYRDFGEVVLKELEKPEPEIKTKVSTTYRGTCVNLNVAGKNVVELRH